MQRSCLDSKLLSWQKVTSSLAVCGYCYTEITTKGKLMEMGIENFGFCPECQEPTIWTECGRCGNDVCITCHPAIGCDH